MSGLPGLSEQRLGAVVTGRTFRAPVPAQELVRRPRDGAPAPDDRVGLLAFDTWVPEKRPGDSPRVRFLLPHSSMAPTGNSSVRRSVSTAGGVTLVRVCDGGHRRNRIVEEQSVRARGGNALTSSSVHSEIDSWVLAASRRALGAKEADLRFEDVACTSNRLAPARGIVLAGFVGALLWITLIAGAYFLVEGFGL